jgi:DNA topoisomerase-1
MTESKKNLSEAIKRVARQLGNTPTICRKYYIHPAVVSAYGEGRLLAMLCTEAAEIGEDRLHPQERSVMRVLEGATAAQSEAGEDR